MDLPPEQLPHPPATESLPKLEFESTEDSEFDGYNTSLDPHDDIANTHASNEELRGREVTKACFEIFKNLDSLESEGTRDLIGSLPSEWSNEAIPLFELNGNDYQLHFAYTWMKALHTYTIHNDPTPEVADWDLHGLAMVTESGISPIVRPLFIIPLGKLFIHQSKYSVWTGYELFLSDELEVWMIYAPTEENELTWNVIDPGLIDDQGHRSDLMSGKLALFCESLCDLEKATFEGVKNTIKSNKPVLSASFYLLELPASEI